MKILRTPDHCFANLPDYPFEPHYTVIKTHDGSDLRIHHIDVGPKDGPLLLCMHGQPVWSYLYTKMIPLLIKAGIRVIAPDLPGYGKSDKPAAREDYSYQRQVDWMNQWLTINDFKNLTFFGQDWGGLIGLRMVVDNDDRFDRVAIGNTTLPYSPNVPQDVIEAINTLRADPKKLKLFTMNSQLRKMNGTNSRGSSSKEQHGALIFAYWQKYTWETPDMPAGNIASIMMEKRNMLSMALDLLMRKIGLGNLSPFRTATSKAFEAPFPSPSYKMATRAMPSQVPTIPDQSLEAHKKAWEFFEKFTKPLLCIGAGNDPITNGFEKQWIKKVPGAKDQPHTNIGGGHFFQWTKPEKLSAALIDFIKNN